MFKTKTRVKKLQDVLKVQLNNGNWNYDSYMHGFANALILANSIMTDTEAKFKDAPKKWLSKNV